MRNFLYKELKLCFTPVNFLFLLITMMILIPNYPCYVPFFYIGLSIFFIFNNAIIGNDIEYSMILPIRKKDIVKSRCIVIAIYEIVSIIFTIPFAYIITQIWKMENLAGIDANVAFYGLVLILLTIFNFVLITGFYKTGDKIRIPFILATILYWIFYAIFEFPIWTKDVFGIAFFQMIDKTDKVNQIKQLPILAVGIVIYSIGWFLTYKKAAKNFEKVDL